MASEPNPQVIVIAGPNGAGKTTLAPSLLRDRLGLLEYVNADTIAQGLSAFQPEQVAIEAGRITLQRLRNLAEKRVSFAFESTLAGRSYAVWLDRLRQQGYQFDLLFVWLSSPEIAIQRVAERVRDGGHSIPEEVIRRRYQSGLRNFFSLYQPIADNWVVYDNSGSGVPPLIAKGKRKTERVIFDQALWRAFCEATG
jgi:predicted ABC-type ATPase